MEERCAIILKSDISNRNKITVLDRDAGVCTLYVHQKHACCCGAFVRYHAEMRAHSLCVRELSLCSIPAFSSVPALLFFHQVLEICLHSVPCGDAAEDVFDLVAFLYSRENSLLLDCQQAAMAQKVFLCKLFIVLGMYPDDKKFQKLYFKRIMIESIDSLMLQPIDLVYEGELDEWIRACFAIHPYRQSFKTTRCVINK